MANDPGMEMLKAGTEGAVAGLAAPVVAAFRALFGDTVQALDDYGALKIVLRHEELRQRVIETVVRSIAMCEAAGVEPKDVGLKVGLPILQHVAVEDDEGMRERWAALLANAAAGVGGAAVSPAFPGSWLSWIP